LDHHHVEYSEEEYVPFVTEPLLRARMRRPSGKVSVPVLLAPDQVVDGSWEVARWAETHGGGAPLLTDEVACRRWDELAQAAMAMGRARVARATLDDPEAQAEALPPFVPKSLRGASSGVARWACRKLLSKYGPGDPGAMNEVLDEARDAIGDGDHVLRAFSYADILVAGALEFVSPYAGGPKGTRAGHRRYRRGPATRRAWTNARLADEYGDLLEWRDRLYARHR
tara:strand:- start:1834 stop:2511 length:678 start_codon:yes stop_codon:yes gene_type:complete